MVENTTTEEKPLVTITGVNGYLGAHVCLKFLEDGRFRVRGTVRDKWNERKVAPLRTAFHDFFTDLELVTCDLLKHETIADAIIGSKYVVHTAFAKYPDPVHDEPGFQEEVAKQTQVILEACRANKVKRLVLTSTLTNITETTENLREYDESVWSDLDRLDAYCPFLKAKFIQEEMISKFVASETNDFGLEFASICPGMIVGPTLL